VSDSDKNVQKHKGDYVWLKNINRIVRDINSAESRWMGLLKTARLYRFEARLEKAIGRLFNAMMIEIYVDQRKKNVAEQSFKESKQTLEARKRKFEVDLETLQKEGTPLSIKDKPSNPEEFASTLQTAFASSVKVFDKSRLSVGQII